MIRKIISYLSSILSTITSNLGSIISSSPVALEALDLMLAYSSKARAEERNEQITM
jgi:hypothetical protein